ncbi:MAG: hypothetical protein AAF512_06600 [Pseudomonadota bacterium]
MITLSNSTVQTVQAALQRLNLPDEYQHTIDRGVLPLVEFVSTQHQSKGQPYLLGINGPQGSGKSTIVEFLKIVLENEFGLKVCTLSIDDFYLSKANRIALAEQIHPHLATRGVPGTHDPQLAMQTFQSLLAGNETTGLPGFDKTLDDTIPKSDWLVWHGAVDVILFEGWNVGVRAQSEADLSKPINTLEEQDTDGIARRYTNSQISQTYRLLFDTLDALVFFAIPDWSCVFNWRLESEQRRAAAEAAAGRHDKTMSEAEVQQFVMYYERLTRWMQIDLPNHADIVLTMDEKRQIDALSLR